MPGRTPGKSCRLIGALLGLDPGSDAAHRHVDALLPGMLRHFSSRAPSTADQEPGGDPLPDADGPDQLAVKLDSISKMSAQQVADAWAARRDTQPLG